MNVNRHFGADAQQMSARIFQAPIDIRHHEASVSGHFIAGHGDRGADGQFVPGAMQAEYSLHLHFRPACGRDPAGNPCGRKGDLGKPVALEHLCAHIAVAILVAAGAARAVHNDGPAGAAGGWVEANRSAAELEAPVHSMKECRQRKADLRARRVERKRISPRERQPQRSRRESRGDGSKESVFCDWHGLF